MTSQLTVAVHALVYLNHKRTVIASDDLAKNVCTNPARIRQIMAKLKKAGLISTKVGNEGGYLFERDAQNVTLRDVCEAVDDKIVSASWHSGNSCMECLIASGMAGIMDEIYNELNEDCKTKLEQITIKDIDSRIFKI